MLKSLFAKPHNQSGDTIVEVLISVAICGFVLGGSYYVINHQLAQIENQQEHNQAAKLVESQVEDIKAYIVTGSLANVVCFYYDGSSLVAVTDASQPQGSNHCIVNNSSAMAAAGSEPAYIIGIQPNVQESATTYTISTKWQSVNGGNAEVNLSYRPT
jgi:hypothetical protein